MKPGVLFMPRGNLQYSQLPPAKRGWVARESYAKIFEAVDRLGIKSVTEAVTATEEYKLLALHHPGGGRSPLTVENMRPDVRVILARQFPRLFV